MQAASYKSQVRGSLCKTLFDFGDKAKPKWQARMIEMNIAFGEFVEFLLRCSEDRYRGSGTAPSRLDRMIKILAGVSVAAEDQKKQAEAEAEEAQAAAAGTEGAQAGGGDAAAAAPAAAAADLAPAAAPDPAPPPQPAVDTAQEAS